MPANHNVVHVDQDRASACLGASEAAGVLGLDKFNPPIAIWRRLRGLPDRSAANDNASQAAAWGTLLEPVVRGYYATTHGRRILVPTRSVVVGKLRCTPDGYDVGEAERGDVRSFLDWSRNGAVPSGALGAVQIKTCSAYLLDDWRDGPPPKYEVQCRTELALTGLPWSDIVCLVGGQQFVGPFRIMRDAAKEQRILDALHSFLWMVASGREPDVDHTAAWRLHVSEKLDRARPVTVVANDNFAEVIGTWRSSRAALKRAEQAEEEHRNRILLHLSAAGATRVDAGPAGKINAYRTLTGTWAIRAPSFWRHDEEAA